ncbi:hypothetical protein BT93_J0049 [Corymbia citriodora subsp. variegata]|nr:hypothetical protein BT93_J0049 [Corymbia citriodora subsp. variegata]
MGELDLGTKEDEASKKAELPGKTQTAPGSLRMVLKNSDWKDMLLMALGTTGCVADGLTMCLIMIVLSNLMNGYAGAYLGPRDFNKYALDLFYVAVAVGSGSFLEGFCWARTAERQIFRLRQQYLQAVLRQEVGFFDQTRGAPMTSQVVSRISVDTLTIQGVLTEKIANFITNISMFIGAQLAALYLCWRLAIVAIPALLMLIIPGLVYGKLLVGVGEKIQEASAVASGIVEQALSSIRTVYSYVGEKWTANSYRISLEPVLKLGIKQGLIKGMAIGSIGISYAVWALQGWYGSILVTDKGFKGGNVFAAGVCIIYGGLALGSALINFKYFSEANVAASRICEMIERVPRIDLVDKEGTTLPNVRGEVEFKDLYFAYPSRPDDGLANVGFVGRSGSGKSTIINLLERFYDPIKGDIFLDGTNIKTLQLKWLRSQMGLVSQEPILFATTIKENILFGKEGATMEEIIKAATAANAHNFITQLPNGYDTQVGQLGIQMSEGQKQRISIARALLRDPRVLLLDEATSALDSHSEKAVQDALNEASIGRTTVVVAHHLSALSNANLIVVIQSGEVIESGSHDKLMENEHGPYSRMVQLQRTSGSDGTVPSSQGEDFKKPSSIIRKTTLLDELNNDPQIRSPESKLSTGPEDHGEPSSFWSMVRLTLPEWKSTVLGCLGAIFYGFIQPLHSFFLGALLAVYVVEDHDMIRSQTRVYCLAFLALAIFAFITNVIQNYYFGVEWFDQEDNNSGALCSRLATDAAMVRNLVADRVAFFTQATSAATSAVILGLLLSWRLALVATALQPLVIGAFYIRMIMMKTMSKKILRAQNQSSELASEAVANHRVITAFDSEQKILNLYENTQSGPREVSHKQSWLAGGGLFIAQFLTTVNATLIFWYGGRLLYHGEITYKHIFQTFFILVSTGRIIAETGSMTADLSKGTDALKAISAILNRKSKMDPNKSDGFSSEKVRGDVEFKQVDFFYPTRPRHMILKDMNLHVGAGKIVALVGKSGSGKSTIVRLIERFYDPTNGTVEVDGIDIRSYNLRGLRSCIALVSQEPTIFAATIHENIRYGRENATDSEVIAAATLANAHEFVSSMEDGYATYCGERGVQLSGGQRQRLALARAILKDPTILLLDEATSALDSESERQIQEALEKTMTGRTCVVVAHRLSTIQRSDKITVLDKGKIIEEGSHSELLAEGENGLYFSLVKVQQLAATT